MDVHASFLKYNIPKSIGHYIVLYLLGQGRYSEVYQGQHVKTNQFVAMKFVLRETLKEKMQITNFEKEIRVIEQVKHPGIVEHIETIYTKDFIIIVQELLSGGTLTSVIRAGNTFINEKVFLRWAKEILEALSFLHKKGICHGDIKPDNIGFDESMHAKLFDFGLCIEKFAIPTKIVFGTPLFIAPEVIHGKIHNPFAVDIWAFGVTLHFLIAGEFPFKSLSTFFRDINKQDFIIIKCGGIFKQIIQKILVIDPKMRPTADQLLETDLFRNAEVISEKKKPHFKRIRKSAKCFSQLRRPTPIYITPKPHSMSQKPMMF